MKFIPKRVKEIYPLGEKHRGHPRSRGKDGARKDLEKRSAGLIIVEGGNLVR